VTKVPSLSGLIGPKSGISWSLYDAPAIKTSMDWIPRHALRYIFVAVGSTEDQILQNVLGLDFFCSFKI
jgi:hypothetical protein